MSKYMSFLIHIKMSPSGLCQWTTGSGHGLYSDTYTGLTVAIGHITLPFYEDKHWFPKHMTRTKYFKVKSSISCSE